MHEAPAGTFARRLKQEREAAGLSQRALAQELTERLGATVYPSAVTNMENGTRSVKVEEAVAIAEVLDVGLADLLRERDAVDDEVAELRRGLDQAKFKADQAEAAFQQAQDEVRAIRRRIAELEKTRRS